MKYKIILFCIVLIAAFFRFFQLGINPPSLTWDEVALGYNAYSLGLDGKDEFGQFLPTAFIESFGDYKPPMYAYLDIIPIKIFGLTDFAVRFPSAFFGTVTVFITYFLIKKIFFASKQNELYAIAGATVLALSPWHIMLSRAAFEANIATFFLVAGIWTFLCAIRGRKWLLLISVVLFASSLYTFNSSRIVAPILVGILVLVFHKTLLKMKKESIFSAILGVCLIAPLVPFMLSPQAKVRFQEVNIFTDPKLIENRNQQIINDNNSLPSRLIHNYRVIYGLAFLDHYFDHFNPSFLFTRGDINPKFSIQDTGQLYLIELPFLLLGMLFLFRKREGYWWIIPVWILIGIIPAGTARETPHALRIEAILPTYQIVIGYGVICFAGILRQAVRKSVIRNAFYALIVILLAGNVFYFQYEYYSHYPVRFSADWQYGYKESIAYIKDHQDEYSAIYDDSTLGRPYIYYLFYTKTDPREFRESSTVKRDVFGFVDVVSFDKFHFVKDMSTVKKDPKNLYVTSSEILPDKARELSVIKRLDGVSALRIYTY